MDLYFTPEYGKTGNAILRFLEKAGRFDIFHLKNWNPDGPRDIIEYGCTVSPRRNGKNRSFITAEGTPEVLNITIETEQRC